MVYATLDIFTTVISTPPPLATALTLGWVATQEECSLKKTRKLTSSASWYNYRGNEPGSTAT